MPISLNETQIYIIFGGLYAARGEAYANSNKVKRVIFEPSPPRLVGLVQGSRTAPYDVALKLHKDGSKILSFSCSCPMGGFCKHSAALAIQAIRMGILPNSRPTLTFAPAAADEWTGRLNSTKKTPADKPLDRHLSNWLAVLNDAATLEKKTPTQTDFVLYLLSNYYGQLTVKCEKSRRLKNGSWGGTQSTDIGRIAENRAQYVTQEDADICSVLYGVAEGSWTYGRQFPSMPELSTLLIQRLVATGRLFWERVDRQITHLGPEKNCELVWKALDNGEQSLKFQTDKPEDLVLCAGDLWYVNPAEKVIGPLASAMTPSMVRCILQAPPVPGDQALAFCHALEQSGLDIPRPVTKYKIVNEVLKPTARLTLRSEKITVASDESRTINIAELRFDYGDIDFDHDGNRESRIIKDSEILVQRRDLEAERLVVALVKKYDLGVPADDSPDALEIDFESFEESDTAWPAFLKNGVEDLTQKGLIVAIDESFNCEIVEAEDDWQASASGTTDFWFNLDLGVMAGGERISLLPVISEAILHLRGTDMLAGIEKLNVQGKFYAPIDDGKFIELPFERVRAVVHTLLDLFDRPYPDVESPKVNLPQMIGLAPQIATSNYAPLKKLLDRIKNFDGLKTIVPPTTFKAELRPYQLEGLAWMDFIREFGLGGILADDMGLGKTVQTLAHIACEKKAKRVDKPYLIICPTSVLPNWVSEIKKFTPGLKVLALSGLARTADFDKIGKADIVVTTYPLISRDIDVLKSQKWQAAVLDEAQYIKNPQTQVAQAVLLLECDYRLCLTGTPIENHLGELWSQINFLMPGFLGDLKTFTRAVRYPIEKHNDPYVQKLLSAKVAPFMLRRTKEVVARDLPEKTEIIKTVELEGAQRDLYETVRLAMYQKVQDALADKGLARSQIVILDALLKLRQVCCDPRLLKLPSAAKVKKSAKLDQLVDMLEELVAEGKRVLLFSQFTSMLDLIEPELDKREIEYVQIRGTTKDRATPVKEFQNGDVPVFLLSLKAGGTGLNLTAADTVIHYDPWWNPAVENQATDRAHRIGQQNKVFVFKLIAAGTIEEKMLEMQDKKRALASAIYGDEEAIASKLTADDLAELFKPLG